MQPFEAGQVWTYDMRAGEDASRIVVCRVEDDANLGQIVHIQIDGIRLKNGRAPGGFITRMGHMPYAGSALRACVVQLESSGNPLPAFEEGYRTWREAFDRGKAGVWTLPVAEAVESMASVLDR